jgi:hypothetical protein
VWRLTVPLGKQRGQRLVIHRELEFRERKKQSTRRRGSLDSDKSRMELVLPGEPDTFARRYVGPGIDCIGGPELDRITFPRSRQIMRSF